MYSIYDSRIHKAITQTAGYTEFTPEQIQILVNNVNKPDDHDYVLDRLWKHSYIVPSNFGNAPGTCLRCYADAVNNQNFESLAWASHYLQDVGCVFHTTLRGQSHHIWYETTMDGYSDEFLIKLGQENLSSIEIKNIEESVVDLATSSYRYEIALLDAIKNNDFEQICDITYDRIVETTQYTMGLYAKYKNDLGITIKTPMEPSLNMTSAAILNSFTPLLLAII